MYGPLFTHKIKEIYMISLKDIEKELKEIKKNTGLELEVKNFNSSKADEIYQQLTYINRAYKEKYDVNYFWKNVLKGTADEELLEQAKSYGVAKDNRYGVVIIESKSNISGYVNQIIGQLFPIYLYNYVVKLKDNRVAFIHSYDKDEDNILENIAHVIVDTLTTEAMMSVKASYSEQYNKIDDLHDSYKKALTALEIGEMFYYQDDIYAYQQMGMGEMICELSDEVCKKFLDSIPGIKEIAGLDPDLINAVTCFLDNNLNIAETSRQVHMHRNTLVYRIEQIEKKTGFDIREFEDAMILKVALMILKSRKVVLTDE